MQKYIKTSPWESTPQDMFALEIDIKIDFKDLNIDFT